MKFLHMLLCSLNAPEAVKLIYCLVLMVGFKLSWFVGELNPLSVGTNFMPHIITVNAGEVRYFDQ